MHPPRVVFYSLFPLYGITFAGITSYGANFGFIGVSITLYQPECAWSCLFCIAPPLNCTTEDLAVSVPEKRDAPDESAPAPQYPSGNGWNVTLESTPQCKANNDFYLQTVAYCLKSRCTDLPSIQLEEFWDRDVPFLFEGNKGALPVPRQSYTQVLGAIKEPPTELLNNTVFLNYTAVVPDDIYIPEYNTLRYYAANEVTHEIYGLAIFLSGVAIPISVSLLRFLPWPTSWVTKFNAYLIDPPLLGHSHSAPIWGLGIMPTRGQALFIAYLWLINILLSACGYEVFLPSLFYPDKQYQVETWVANRFGVLSFAQLPLVLLYAGRNNILLWLTNWSHSTFLLLHRWAAFLCMLQAVLHSIVYLHMAVAHLGGLDHAEESVEPYWYWGIIGTLAMALMVVLSVQPIRQRVYEAFLAIHIALAVMTIVGCYYHITPKYGQDYGFQTWLYITIALWVFDRAARLARSIRGGIKRAYLSPIDDDYYRLDIPNATASGHIYLHFPTISLWRVWENHPFSVAGVVQPIGPGSVSPLAVGLASDSPPEKTVGAGDEQPSRSSTPSEVTVSDARPAKAGIVLFVRKHDGITSMISKCKAVTRGIRVLIESSYAPNMTFLQDGLPTPTHDFPNLICVAGGVGITGVLPSLDSFTNVAKSACHAQLFWGVRTMPLVHAVENMLGYECGDVTERRWGSVQVTLSVGVRFNLRDMLEKELGSCSGGTTVVVCGPPSMADEVRCVVSALSRHNGSQGTRLVKLVVESFSW